MSDQKPTTPALRPDGLPEKSSGDEISAFLDRVRSMAPVQRKAGERGRLIFAMDATMSRQPTWDRALAIQAEMFAETSKIGGLDVQLVYFRGFHECRASPWVSEPADLARLMTRVDCRGGNTQISRVLKHIRAEVGKKRVGAVVYVGDCMEENVDELCALAGEIGLLGTPVFMFQEGFDPIAERAFKEIARLTRGAWCRFDAASPRTLRDLLKAAAVYAAGGTQALADYSKRHGEGARLLIEQMK
jgi:hypothetical protein